jgi:hypothetical protein
MKLRVNGILNGLEKRGLLFANTAAAGGTLPLNSTILIIYSSHMNNINLLLHSVDISLTKKDCKPREG